jgi:hypothetical protein
MQVYGVQMQTFLQAVHMYRREWLSRIVRNPLTYPRCGFVCLFFRLPPPLCLTLYQKPYCVGLPCSLQFTQFYGFCKYRYVKGTCINTRSICMNFHWIPSPTNKKMFLNAEWLAFPFFWVGGWRLQDSNLSLYSNYLGSNFRWLLSIFSRMRKYFNHLKYKAYLQFKYSVPIFRCRNTIPLQRPTGECGLGKQQAVYYNNQTRHLLCGQNVLIILNPIGVTGILHWVDPSGRIMALASTPPLTGMSTRNTSLGVKVAGA